MPLTVPDAPQYGEYQYGDTLYGERTKAGTTVLADDTTLDTFPVFDVGDLVRIGATFLAPYTDHPTPIPGDPGAVSVQIEQPDGTITTFTYLSGSEIVRYGTGQYRVDFTIDQAGRWTYRWLGSGAIQAVDEGEFYVRGRQTQ